MPPICCSYLYPPPPSPNPTTEGCFILNLHSLFLGNYRLASHFPLKSLVRKFSATLNHDLQEPYFLPAFYTMLLDLPLPLHVLSTPWLSTHKGRICLFQIRLLPHPPSQLDFFVLDASNPLRINDDLPSGVGRGIKLCCGTSQ